MSQFRLGSAYRAQMAAEPGVRAHIPSRSRSGRPPGASAPGDSTWRPAGLPVDPFDRHVSGRRSQYDVEGARSELQRRVRDAIEQTTATPIDTQAVLRGHGSGHPIGTPAWLDEAKRSGVYFPLPRGLRGIMEFADQWSEDYAGYSFPLSPDDLNALGADNGEARRDYEFWSNFGAEVVRMNGIFRGLVENGAMDEELLQLAGSVVSPRAMLGDNPDDPDQDQLKGDVDYSKFFGTVYAALGGSGEMAKKMVDKLGDIDGILHPFIGTSLGRGGVDLLLEEAREMDLDIYGEPEQYKVDVSVAILRFLQDISGDQMAWSREEREYFDRYIDGLREQAVEDPVGALQILEGLVGRRETG